VVEKKSLGSSNFKELHLPMDILRSVVEFASKIENVWNPEICEAIDRTNTLFTNDSETELVLQ
jgi:hypothetical protein